MRQSIPQFIRNCYSCQKRKDGHEFVAPLGESEETTAPLEVTSMDITGPYPLTPRKNKHLYVHLPIYKICWSIYHTRPDGRQLRQGVRNTDHHTLWDRLEINHWSEQSLYVQIFQWNLQDIRRSKTPHFSRHPLLNGTVERLHRFIHAGLSHYVNTNNTNWDVLTPFFLMVYRATPHTVIQFSPFYLLHGREMLLPNNDKGENFTTIPWS
jgi:hypothetical protein